MRGILESRTSLDQRELKNDGYIELYLRQKNWGYCHHLLLVYDASKLSTVYVVKSPVLGFSGHLKIQNLLHLFISLWLDLQGGSEIRKFSMVL